MNHSKLIPAVSELLTRVDSPPEERLPHGADEITIAEFEQRRGIRVPPAMRKWLMTCNGPCVGPGGLTGIKTRRVSQDLDAILEMRPEWTEKGWLPVAGDGCGNYYFVPARGDFGHGEPVFFVDVLRDVSIPAYLVASDTWHFIWFLLMRELGESRWPFDQEYVAGVDPAILTFRHAPLPWDVP